MKRNRSKARREEKEARKQPGLKSFIDGCHHCGRMIGEAYFLAGTLAGGLPMLLCHPCGRRLMAEAGA